MGLGPGRRWREDCNMFDNMVADKEQIVKMCSDCEFTKSRPNPDPA